MVSRFHVPAKERHPAGGKNGGENAIPRAGFGEEHPMGVQKREPDAMLFQKSVHAGGVSAFGKPNSPGRPTEMALVVLHGKPNLGPAGLFVNHEGQIAVGRAAGKIVVEIARQFKEIHGLLQGKAEPEPAKIVDIATTAALWEMILPGMIAIVAPVVVGFVMGPQALAGLLAGGLAVGAAMSLFMANAGGAWDNAKKFIEKGGLPGHKKGSDAHKAAVVGDMVGDPFKDTSGPGIAILITVMSVVSLLIA